MQQLQRARGGLPLEARCRCCLPLAILSHQTWNFGTPRMSEKGTLASKRDEMGGLTLKGGQDTKLDTPSDDRHGSTSVLHTQPHLEGNDLDSRLIQNLRVIAFPLYDP